MFLQVLQAFSDALYVSPAVYSVGTFLRRTKNVYFYHFAHRSKMDPYGLVKMIFFLCTGETETKRKREKG